MAACRLRGRERRPVRCSTAATRRLPSNAHGVTDDAGAGAARHDGREESLASTDFRELNQAEDARAIEALMRRFARRLNALPAP